MKGHVQVKVKLIAPFKTNFNILYFHAMKDYGKYLHFWDTVKKQYENDEHIHFLATSETDFIYENIALDGNNFSPEIFFIKNDPVLTTSMREAFNSLKDKKFNITYDSALEETVCRMYDNAIGIMETTIYINEEINQSDKKKWLTFIAYIQNFSNEYMKFFIRNYYEKSIETYIEGIYQLDHDHYLQKNFVNKQLLNKEDKKVHKIVERFIYQERVAKPLWVNRTLFLASLENKFLFYNHWLSLGEEGSNQVDQQIDIDKFYLGWGNNLVIDTYDEQILSSGIEALNICQYYNVILEHINNQLSKLVGEVYSIKGKGKMIKRIEQLLEVNIENANLLFMLLNEQAVNLQGHRKKYFEELLKKWKIKSFQISIEKKITFSKEKIDYFYRKGSKFSHTVSESILFGIGGIALVDFFANISQFSRTIKVNPEMGKVDDDSFGFITLGQIVSPDNMIWSGLLTLLFLFFVFIYVKRRS